MLSIQYFFPDLLCSVLFVFLWFNTTHTKKNSSFLTSTTFGLFKLPNDFSLTLAKFSNSACCVCFQMKKNDEDS
uniref:Putative secreted protein n=1 Tax=Rhipicephalus microplus TaxID=6941 RepID=A0A6M2DBF1_RHIMP